MKICVIGTGFGGGPLLSEITKTSNQINIFDISKFQSKKNSNLPVIFPKVVNLNNENLIYHGLGGGSNLWHGVITNLDKSDKDKFKDLGLDIDKIEKKYNERALNFLNIKYRFSKNKIFSFKNWFLKKIEKTNKFIIKKFFIQTFPKNTKTIIEKIKNKKNVKLFEECCVLNFIVNKNNKKITHLVYYDNVKKNKFLLKADLFILCAGAIETPRILLQTFKENKIPKNPAVGVGLNDHYKVEISVTKNNKNIYSDNWINKKLKSRIGFIPKNVNKGNFCLIMRPNINQDYILLIEKFKNFLTNKNIYPLFNFLRFITIKNLLLVLNRIFFNKKPIIGNIFEIWIDTKTSKRNKVYLNNKKDFMSRYIPVINFKLSKYEYDQITYCQNFLKKNFKILNHNKKLIKKTISSSAHFTNTCRIGSKISNSVVDKNLKCHNFNNLYLCDNSIINYIGNSNPTLTLINFSLRLADHIKKKYKKN